MMGIRGIIGVQIYAVIILVGSTGLFAGLGQNTHIRGEKTDSTIHEEAIDYSGNIVRSEPPRETREQLPPRTFFAKIVKISKHKMELEGDCDCSLSFPVLASPSPEEIFRDMEKRVLVKSKK